MLALLLLAGVVAAVASTPIVVDLAVGSLLFGGVLALAHGEFGSALFALVVLSVVCVYWSWPRSA